MSKHLIIVHSQFKPLFVGLHEILNAKTEVLNLRPSFVQMTKPPWITFRYNVVKCFDSPDVFLSPIIVLCAGWWKIQCGEM